MATKIAARDGYEVWAQYDETAAVIELFASEEMSDYIGCADTLPQARALARAWIAERREG